MIFRNFTTNLQLARNFGFRFLKPKLFGFAKAYVKPLELIKQDVVSTRNRIIQQMSYSCSTIVVEKMLNDEFDEDLKRIRIQNLSGGLFEHAIVRRIEEGESVEAPPEDCLIVRRLEEPEFMDPTYQAVYRIEESGNNLAFLVLVNNEITYDQNLMIKRVNRYRTAGKTWGIYNTDLPESEIVKINQFNISE